MWDAHAFPASVASNFTVGSRVAGYRLEQMIGRGGMAMVFRAIDERLGRQVALKILAPALAENTAFRQRFVAESRMAAAVDDPHIIPVHEAGEAAGVLFIAMRYVPGGDVRTLLRQSGPMSGARAASIISPVASALDAAHSAGLIHRDVKPGNMLLDTRLGRPDHVYLSDFGLSKESVSPTGLTQTGQILGTPAYSAPEQVEGKPLDGRADEYSLACAAFEMLTGAPPFVQTHVTALILAQMSAPPPSLTSRRPDLPAAADRVFARALAKKADDRYATCREFADDLRLAFGLVPYDSGPDIIVPPVHTPTKVASLGGASTKDVVGSAGDTPTNVIIDKATSGSGQDGAGEQLPAPPADVSTERSTPTPERTAAVLQPGRRAAAVPASALIILAAVAAIGSFVYPGPLTAATRILLVPYLLAVVLAVWLLVRNRQAATAAAISLGLWAPAAGFLAADVVAVTVDHSFGYTGHDLVSYYIGVLSDLLGVAALLLLWSIWRSYTRVGGRQPRRGLPTTLLGVVGLISLAQLVIFVSFGTESGNNDSAYDYIFGGGVLVAGLAAAWIATKATDRALGGALLLGWATTMLALTLDLMTAWSSNAGIVKLATVLMLLLIIGLVVLTIAYIARGRHQGSEPRASQ